MLVESRAENWSWPQHCRKTTIFVLVILSKQWSELPEVPSSIPLISSCWVSFEEEVTACTVWYLICLKNKSLYLRASFSLSIGKTTQESVINIPERTDVTSTEEAIYTSIVKSKATWNTLVKSYLEALLSHCKSYYTAKKKGKIRPVVHERWPHRQWIKLLWFKLGKLSLQNKNIWEKQAAYLIGSRGILP